MKTKSKTAAMFLMASTLLVATACSSGDETKSSQPSDNPSPSATSKEDNKSTAKTDSKKIKMKVITITTDENRNKIMEKFIKPNIATALPNLEVEFEPGGGGEDMANKLKTLNASGDMPDVFWNDAGYFTPLKSTGSILDLTPYISKDGFLGKYAVPDALKHVDNGIYSLSSGADTYFTPVIFYHKDMFEKAGVKVPTTFDELIQISKTLKSKGMVPAVTPGKDGWGPKLFMLQQMIQTGDPQAMADLVSNKTDFNNPSVKEGAARIEKLVKEGVFPDGIANIDYGPAMEMFTSKKAAMLWQFTWELPNLAKDETVDFFPFPSASDKYNPTKNVQFWGSPVNGYAVNGKTKNPEEAVKLAEFLAMADALYFESTGAPISLKTGNKAMDRSPLMQKFVDWYNPIPNKIASWALNSLDAKTSAEVSTQGANLLTGEYSADKFNDAMNKIWSQNTWFAK
ncbi:extracellular solute-binding protein [Paenibacillus sp. CGMCC 1.16610]|uniref:Extracellular solute-binding protein n=1 Tax=Paenibacillus anseongense TaxID=2682845 RepID=A0ABW9UGQ1_9BACL|nr:MULTISPECIES: extracellular solute-binding protein [Paenibacillus]MBA2939687.1 extracellular solute-binding protein [Paenibacillus sp. CGMCC 1.16610]MVQ39347.1 extracellular solute-binding protein [Paenibacillus anseongense]